MSRSVKADEFFISIQLFFQKMIPLKPDLEEPERWAKMHGIESVCESWDLTQKRPEKNKANADDATWSVPFC